MLIQETTWFNMSIMRVLQFLPLVSFPFIATAQIRFPAPAPAPAPTPTSVSPTPDAATAARPAAAAVVAPLPSISFEVKVMRAGASTDLKQGSSAAGLGSKNENVANTLERTKYSQVQLEIALRNFATREASVNVEWIFFSTPISGAGAGSNDIMLFSQGSREVTFKPGGTEKVEATSGAAVSVDSRRSEVGTTTYAGRTTTSYGNAVTKSGQKIAGWLVQLRAGEKVLGFKASSPRFEVYGRDANALAALKGPEASRPATPHTGSPSILRPTDIPVQRGRAR